MTEAEKAAAAREAAAREAAEKAAKEREEALKTAAEKDAEAMSCNGYSTSCNPRP